MAWFWKKKEDGDEDRPKKVVIAEGLWVKCDSCREIVYRAEVERAGRVCPKCGYPFRISARERLSLLCDSLWEEFDQNLVRWDYGPEGGVLEDGTAETAAEEATAEEEARV